MESRVLEEQIEVHLKLPQSLLHLALRVADRHHQSFSLLVQEALGHYLGLQVEIEGLEPKDLPESKKAERIIIAVGDLYGYTLADLLSDNRQYAVTEPRQLAMYLVRKWTKLSFPAIGTIFHRDHSTVLHATRKIKDNINSMSSLKKKAITIENSLELYEPVSA